MGFLALGFLLTSVLQLLSPVLAEGSNISTPCSGHQCVASTEPEESPLVQVAIHRAQESPLVHERYYVCQEQEHRPCSCDGTVFFGKKYQQGFPGGGSKISFDSLQQQGLYTQKEVSGRVACSVHGIGDDPAPGYYKRCFCVAGLNERDETSPRIYSNPGGSCGAPPYTCRRGLECITPEIVLADAGGTCYRPLAAGAVCGGALLSSQPFAKCAKGLGCHIDPGDRGSLGASGTCQLCHTIWNKKCVFPFTYEGVTYNECTSTGYYRKWCSTKTENGLHQNGNWGSCTEDCQ